MRRLRRRIREWFHKIRFEDVLIILIIVSTFFFVRAIMDLFRMYGTEPSSLVAGYFSLVTAELAILWRLHEARKKRQKEEKEAALEPLPDGFEEVDIDEHG
jgi:hypothetical protein